MRMLRIGLIGAVGLGCFGVDVGESVRAGAISDARADAKHHKHPRHHHRHKRHHKHHAPPPPEM